MNPTLFTVQRLPITALLRFCCRRVPVILSQVSLESVVHFRHPILEVASALFVRVHPDIVVARDRPVIRLAQKWLFDFSAVVLSVQHPPMNVVNFLLHIFEF